MTWTSARPWVSTLARLLLGVVWIWAALSKLHDPLTFTQTVRAYDATPEWLSKAIGYGLPVLELCLGLALIVGVAVRIAAAVSAALFAVFLIGIIQAAVRGIKLTCGCFGGGGTTNGSTSYTVEILRDLGLLIVAVFLVIYSVTRFSVEEFLTRHDHVEMPSAKRMRNPDARRRYEAAVAARQQESRARARYLDGSIVLVVALITLIGIGVQAGRAKINNVQDTAHATASQGVVFGKPAAATVDVYEDFGCPICKQFESTVATKLDQQVRRNLAQVRFHPISILDRGSPNQYSTRSANAALCVSNSSVDDYVTYHNLLYAGSFQPTEGTAGPSDAQLTSLANKAGVGKSSTTALSTCISNGTYEPLVKAFTEKASENGVNGTPTVFVNGTKVSATAASLFAAIAKANVGHTPTPSVTPSPSTSAAPSSSPAPSSPAPTPSKSTTNKR
ncbi:MAG TPA: MauE/DoxX family redox-associated membrane protein [Jatrophihabitans sp.]|jgi:protein-disulfide isomerase